LGHAVNADEILPALLHGWKRYWNVGSDNDSHPERRIRESNGTPFNGVVAVLGITSAGAPYECNGVVFPVTADDLAKLDARERNYRRVDITQAVTFNGMPPNSVVFTYVPLQSAIDRLATARESGREIAIRRGYFDLVREGFTRIGALGEYEET